MISYGQAHRDRNQKWEVHRRVHDRRRLKVLFASGTPGTQELIAVRKLFPQFRHMSPSELKATVLNGVLLVGIVEGREAYALGKIASKVSLNLIIEDASYVSYLAFNASDRSVWLIENEPQCRALCEEMIAAGIPVIDSEN
jgi:hypothetical protein